MVKAVLIFQFSLTEPKVIIGLFNWRTASIYLHCLQHGCRRQGGWARFVREVRRQIQAKPGILTGADTPDYGTCVDIRDESGVARK